MNITPIVTGYIYLISIGYKYKSCKVLVFIAAQWGGSYGTGYPYLSCLYDNNYNVSIFPTFGPCILGRCLNSSNVMDNKKYASI